MSLGTGTIEGAGPQPILHPHRRNNLGLLRVFRCNQSRQSRRLMIALD